MTRCASSFSTLDQLSDEARKRLEERRKKEKQDENPLKMRAHKGDSAIFLCPRHLSDAALHKILMLAWQLLFDRIKDCFLR
jgi:hypothetical protein